MSKIKAWLLAARLRTLPLSISGVFVGTGLANYYQYYDSLIFVLAILVTVAFQITSNFANDYGDGIKGTDNEERIGPKRALQSGILSRKELKHGIIYTVVIDVILVMGLLYFSFGLKYIEYLILFLILGFISIWSAIKYTVGKNAYGYRGLGDVFVFIFFGLLAVLGSLFLYTKFLTLEAVLPAISIGALSTAVLNLNNLRDYSSDKNSGKNTLVVKLGFENGKKYHLFLLALAFVSFLFFIVIYSQSYWNFIPLLAFVPIILHIKNLKTNSDPLLLDPELKKLALSTFLLALLFYFSFNNFL